MTYLSLSLSLFAVHVVSVLGRFSEVIDLTKDWRLLRLSAELSSSSLACSPFPPAMTTTTLRTRQLGGSS